MGNHFRGPLCGENCWIFFLEWHILTTLYLWVMGPISTIFSPLQLVKKCTRGWSPTLILGIASPFTQSTFNVSSSHFHYRMTSSQLYLKFKRLTNWTNKFLMIKQLVNHFLQLFSFHQCMHIRQSTVLALWMSFCPSVISVPSTLCLKKKHVTTFFAITWTMNVRL